MDLLQALYHRRSTPSRLLAEPGPDAAKLLELLACAVRVPDHGKLVPWRFICIQGSQRRQLGELLAERALELDPSVAAAVLDKDRQRFSHAPLVVAVIARLALAHKIPVQEQLLSGGAICFQLLLAATAMGFGAQWLTGWAAYDAVVTARLGLAENERVLGFIHIGSAVEPVSERDRPDPGVLLTELQL